MIASLSLLSMAEPLAEKDLEAIKKHVTRTGEAAEWTWVFFGDSITHGALHTTDGAASSKSSRNGCVLKWAM